MRLNNSVSVAAASVLAAIAYLAGAPETPCFADDASKDPRYAELFSRCYFFEQTEPAVQQAMEACRSICLNNNISVNDKYIACENGAKLAKALQDIAVTKMLLNSQQSR
jgi:hypothetical protein